MLGRIPICWSSWWIRIYISHPDLDIASVSILLSPLQVAAVRGCIPVIMMDGVKSEFEDELPLIEYAIRIPGYMAYRYGPLAMHTLQPALSLHTLPPAHRTTCTLMHLLRLLSSPNMLLCCLTSWYPGCPNIPPPRPAPPDPLSRPPGAQDARNPAKVH